MFIFYTYLVNTNVVCHLSFVNCVYQHSPLFNKLFNRTRVSDIC
ncbi:hypothetical protein PBCV1_a351aL [Paramecium bursaria Chlorella virus 1]|uniref:Uncharacterized protein n=1 Tax=Paramecium bursaria Chlorella virus 1 TaxID=10506 RepID=F8TU25_PBCV1|nr:hypothetical protein PBCV1_a351aL [Paramecium bursaria Chlorella virus 1]AEI70086.1 hypothetical protein [Paramecium bursaria Chlorella virus 1]